MEEKHYCIVSWFARLKILVRDGVVTVTPLWADYLIGWSLEDIVEFCALNGYTLKGPTYGS